MKTKMIAAMLAAFFVLPIFGLTAYAAPLDEITEAPVAVVDVEDPGEALEPETDVTAEAPETPDAPDTEEAPETEIPEAVELPALPPGVATVIDFNTDPDGRLFYTIMTPDEHVFYLVIDKNSNTDNVYFLNTVTVADLLALAEAPAQPQGGTTVTPPPATTSDPEPQTETPSPAETPQGGNNMGMYIIIGILVIVGGGAGWYFKIYRPKQQSMASGDEYDPSMNEAENDYADDWDDDSDDGEDSPPWDKDSTDDE